MKKGVTSSISLALVLVCMMSSLCMSVSAKGIAPRYTGISQLGTNLEISSGGCADCLGYVSVQSGYTASMTVELQRDGRGIKSWSRSGAGDIEISKSYYVTSGHDYQVVVSVDVYNSRGTLVETPDMESSVVYY